MNKGLKITAAVVGGIAVTAGLLWAFLPGLPAYIYAKRNYSHINETISEEALIHSKPGEDFREVSCYGLSLMLPPDMQPSKPDDPHPYLYVTQDSPKSGIVFMKEQDPDPPFEMLSEKGYTAEQVEKGMRGIDLKKPENNYEFYDLTYRLTAHTFRLGKHGITPFFISMAKGKELLFDEIESAVRYDTEHGKGFLLVYKLPEGSSRNYKLVVELYDRENLNRAAHAMISSPSYDLAKQIAYSADIVPLTEADMS